MLCFNFLELLEVFRFDFFELLGMLGLGCAKMVAKPFLKLSNQCPRALLSGAHDENSLRSEKDKVVNRSKLKRKLMKYKAESDLQRALRSVRG